MRRVNGKFVNAPVTPLPKNRLRQLRLGGKKKGGLWLTLEEVSKILDISLDHVSRHEQGIRGINEEQLQKYAQLYKVEPHRIFVGLTAGSSRR